MPKSSYQKNKFHNTDDDNLLKDLIYCKRPAPRRYDDLMVTLCSALPKSLHQLWTGSAKTEACPLMVIILSWFFHHIRWQSWAGRIMMHFHECSENVLHAEEQRNILMVAEIKLVHWSTFLLQKRAPALGLMSNQILTSKTTVIKYWIINAKMYALSRCNAIV